MPLAVADDGHDGVEAVERTMEGNALVDVQASTYQVDSKLQEPLLDILVRQCPHGHNAHRRGETVEDGHRTVSET